MKIGLVSSPDEISIDDLKYILRIFNSLKINALVENSIAKLVGIRGCNLGEISDVNYVFIIGSDRTILKTLLYINDKSIPVISLSGRGVKSFLSVASIEDFTSIIKRIIKGDYEVINKLRIEAEVNGQKLPPALNEIALFARLSGKMLRYSLIINNEFIWRDEGDGVIISTPTGSTAYALSAGGVIVMGDANVIEIVPVNTTILTHRPIITSAINKVVIDEINPSDCTLIIDGQLRENIDSGRIIIRKSRYHAKFISFPHEEYSLIYRKLKRRVISIDEEVNLKALPPSSKFIFKVLRYEGPLTTRELINKTGLPPRTVSHALRILLNKGLVMKKSYSRDSRQKLYSINYSLLKDKSELS